MYFLKSSIESPMIPMSFSILTDYSNMIFIKGREDPVEITCTFRVELMNGILVY